MRLIYNVSLRLTCSQDKNIQMKVTYQCCWTSCSEETRTVWRYEVLVNHMSTRYSSDQYVVCQKQTSTEIHLLKSAVQTYQLVHCKVGILVGLLLGFFVGCRVGFFEGFAVGSRVGFLEGFGDGFLVGFPEGLKVGDNVGSSVGYKVGISVGASVGYSVERNSVIRLRLCSE